MQITQEMKQKCGWPRLIRKERERVRESQTEFGMRFGVSAAAVSDWERGVSEAPYAVTWWLYNMSVKKRKARRV